MSVILTIFGAKRAVYDLTIPIVKSKDFFLKALTVKDFEMFPMDILLKAECCKLDKMIMDE